MSEWTTIASASELDAGQMLPIEHGEHYLAIVVIDGQVYAFDDTCTHQECELSDGELEDRVVICPCHEAMFSVETGQVLGGPAERPIRTYAARSVEGRIEVQL